MGLLVNVDHFKVQIIQKRWPSITLRRRLFLISNLRGTRRHSINCQINQMSRRPIRPVGQFSTDLLIFMEPFLQEGNELFLVTSHYKLGNLNFDCRGALGTKGVKIDFFNFRNVAFLRKTLQKGSNYGPI